MGTDNYFIHFNVRVKKSPRNFLTKEYYCTPTDKIGYDEKRLINKFSYLYSIKTGQEKERFLEGIEDYVFFPNKRFKDKEHFSDEYVKKHTEDITKNYELNMKYFNSLDFEDFNKKLLSFVKKNKFIETKDLNDLGTSGIYLMVLDKYKQVYLGQSNNMKKRVQQHWSSEKEFEYKIWQDVDTSILSIDSFGALDTTRIFYKELRFSYLNNIESEYVDTFDSKYLLNRTAGGINGEIDEPLRNIMLLANRKQRKL